MFGCQVDVVCRILLLLDEKVTLPCKIFSSNALFLFLRSFFNKNNFKNKYKDVQPMVQTYFFVFFHCMY